MPAMSEVPLIYNHNRPLPRLTFVGRALAAILGGGSLAVLVMAAILDPSPTGMETHTQLGLPPCGMLRLTGVPCMTCGMTTSFAELAHGHLWQSLVAQPAGTLLALLAAMTFWIGTYIAVTGRPSARLLNQVPWTRLLFSVLGIMLVAWVYKIIVVVHSAH